ncbi:Ribonuclease/ribotoxin [Annulohypoxylon maeteangense]|uniref:Ribonuclease/ribotoxin n=1 Tax=Annulohypoxylon maeteangense TaxID=1927788 RepID=UPI002008E586|nr:Ribonuclease/ribotoxin [Annulohypoxylon maeteangense]KAI0884658.1 Ribonuclease/ribotoxin [Annulohypoxylon maeteangense]
MKSISTLLTAVLFLSVGNGLTIPSDNAVEVRGLEEALDTREIDAIIGERAVKTKYKYANFPSSGTCATQKYSSGNVKDAGDAGGRLEANGKALGRNKYPHQYFNRNNEIKNFSSKCKAPFYEFPILQNHKTFTGNPDTPGADRVVINVSAKDKKTGYVTITFCGLMTHTGAQGGAFKECSWK